MISEVIRELDNNIVDIIGVTCLLGWIPIGAIFSGIAKCIKAYKGFSNDDIDIDDTDLEVE